MTDESSVMRNWPAASVSSTRPPAEAAPPACCVGVRVSMETSTRVSPRPRDSRPAVASRFFLEPLAGREVGRVLLLGDLGPAEVEPVNRVDENGGDEGLGEPLVV